MAWVDVVFVCCMPGSSSRWSERVVCGRTGPCSGASQSYHVIPTPSRRSSSTSDPPSICRPTPRTARPAPLQVANDQRSPFIQSLHRHRRHVALLYIATSNQSTLVVSSSSLCFARLKPISCCCQPYHHHCHVTGAVRALTANCTGV